MRLPQSSLSRSNDNSSANIIQKSIWYKWGGGGGGTLETSLVCFKMCYMNLEPLRLLNPLFFCSRRVSPIGSSSFPFSILVKICGGEMLISNPSLLMFSAHLV